MHKKRKFKIKLNFLSIKGVSVWMIIGAIVALQVVFTIQSSTLGATLADIEAKEKEILEENQRLTSEVVDSTSLSKIEKKTDELGFVKPEYNLYINVDNFVAKADDGLKN
jgi:hypothetical protein